MPNSSLTFLEERECSVFQSCKEKKRHAPALDKQDSRFCDYIKDVNKIGNVIFFIADGEQYNF